MADYLIISDLQIPFEHKDALSFCQALKKQYNIADSNVYCVGDEIDHYYGSLYKKDPNANMTASQEIEQTNKTLRKWYKAFPELKIANSNHGQRWFKKFLECEIPSQLMRSYRELINAPDGWQWADKWIVKTKRPFIVEHGHSYSGMNGHRMAAMMNGMSTVIGHLHSHAGINFVKTNGLDLWAANAGCLIDFQSFAFQYGQRAKFKPTLGALVVFDNGKCPLWIPL